MSRRKGILENLNIILRNNKANDRQEIINHLQKEGQIRLLEAGKDLRIYQFTSYSGFRTKIRLNVNGSIEVLK